MDGLIVVDKPAGWTSHDVVNRMRRIVNTKKVGHLGTLDPMATGVLPLVIGRATRLAQFFQKSDKIYEATIRFGIETTTYDREGEPVGARKDATVDADDLARALLAFRGVISQTPPAVSAKKINGVPAYRLVRKQIAVEMKPVDIEIYSIDVLSVAGADVSLRVHCSTGTYVRSIAHDLGQVLGLGGHLYELRRSASGGFDTTMARTLEELGQLGTENRLAEALIPCADLLPEFPTERVDEITVSQIRQGRSFRVSPFRAERDARFVKAVDREGDLVAIGEAQLPFVYHPVLVI